MTGPLGSARLHCVVPAILVALSLSGCGSSGSSLPEVACSVAGSVRFPVAYLDGPEYRHDEFVDTEPGAILEAFFVGGEGEPENQQYLDSAEFSLASESLVIGFSSGVPVAHFTVEGNDVSSWGGCQPALVLGDLIAYRWRPGASLDFDSAVVPIVVEGGGCVTGTGTDIVTEIESIEVVETFDSVEITVWVKRDEGFRLGCSGVGVDIDATVTLIDEVGNRGLVDAGVIPPRWPG